MKQEIKVPRMGESINEAIVSAILKEAGSQVKVDDELLELATDKVNQVLYAPAAGQFNPSVKVDEVVKIDQVIGYIDTEASGTAKEASPAPEKAVKPTIKEDAKKDTPVKQNEKVEVKKEAPAKPAEGKPQARFGAADFLEDLKKPTPSKAPEQTKSTPPKETQKPIPSSPQTASSSSNERETRRKMSRVRRVIASRLVEVQHTTAMLTTFNEVDMSAIMEIREHHKETFIAKHGVKLGLMSFFVKATVAALKLYPDVNSYIDGEDIVHREYYDIGIAVGTERGLIVPVVRDCDLMSFAQVEKAIVNYAGKVKSGTLSADDLQGAGFTITNGGVYGSLLSTPIISPQQCAILGMHKILKRPIVVKDEIVARPMMYLALSYDHRLIDGKEAVSFLVHIKTLLEDPSSMILNL
jgi:2-oxoglutarate dehydrogenase E2 component (dihydrolipoamide succinyltransferase)